MSRPTANLAAVQPSTGRAKRAMAALSTNWFKVIMIILALIALKFIYDATENGRYTTVEYRKRMYVVDTRTGETRQVIP